MKKYLNLDTLYTVAAIIALSSLLIPRAIDMAQLHAHGISHLAYDGERYHNNGHVIEGDYTVTIDLIDLEGNEGQMLFDRGESQIYVSKVNQNEAGYEVIFRSSGKYSLGGATLVSGIKHFRNLNGYNHDLEAEAQATYNGDTFKLSPSDSSVLNHPSGDEFGFYVFPPNEDIDLAEEPTIEVTVTNLHVNFWAKKVNY